MRNFLTFIAVALVTALTSALVVPPLIDWSARREMVARAIAGRIGEPVHVGGAVTLRLLPTPYLDIADVAIGPRAAPWLTSRDMRIEFAMTSLFGGRIELENVAFDHPTLKLGPRFSAPGEGRVAFEHIAASHAEVSVERAGEPPILLHDLSFDGSAASAQGPFRGQGQFAAGAARAHYEFASGAFAAAALPLKAEFDEGATRVRFDGRLTVGDAPALAGNVDFAGETADPYGGVWPLSIVGDVEASGDEARMDEAEVRLGEEARALEAQGKLTIGLGERRSFSADLKAKTLNIDSLLREDKETFASPARAAQAFATLALRPDAAFAQFALKVQAQTAYLGARSLETPRLDVSRAADGPLRLKLDSGLPGHGEIALDGALELRPAPIFRGRAKGAIGDFAVLATWAAEGEPDLAQRLAALDVALPQGAISAEGDLELSSQGYSLRNLNLGVAASKFNGGAVYSLPTAQTPGRLYLDLASDSLDIDAAPNVEAAFDWLGDTDLDFHLTADRLKVARVGLASVSGGSLAVRAEKTGRKFALDNLSLADFGGASIAAQGETSPSGQWARVKLNAGHLSDFAALLARAAPGAPAQWLLRRADDLGGAKVTFEARRNGPPLSGPFPLDFLKADGEIGGAHFGVTLSRAPAPVDAIAAQATLDSPDAGGFLRKIGLKIPAGPAGHALLSVNGTGQWDRGFDGQAKLAFAGADLAFNGALRGTELKGPLTIRSADVFPALAALGLATPGAAKAPADLAADIAATPDGAEVANLKGGLAGSRIGGRLAFGQPDAAAITGALSLDHASLAALLSLALGHEAARPGALWPDAKFATPLLTPPSVDIALKVDALDAGFAVGRAMSGRLKLDRDRIALEDGSALLNGGKASLRFDIGRGQKEATATGRLGLADVGVARAGASARVDANLDFVGSGDSPAAVIGGLAGAGRVTLHDAKFPRLDPQALTRAFARIEQAAATPPEEKKLEALIGAEADKGPLTVAQSEGALTLSSGALRFGPLDASGGAILSGALGLGDLSLSLEATEVYAGKLSRFWSGPPPTVELQQTTARKIDATMLGAGLSSEAIARESDRIENFEADVRERAMFNRSRKAWKFMDRRAAEIALYLDAQARARLMALYLGPYRQWAAAHEEPPAPAHDAAGL